MRNFVVGLLCFVMGASCWNYYLELRKPANHWKVLDKYLAYVANPSNYNRVDGTLLFDSSPPEEPLHHLAALVALGELEYLDLVFPAIPYASEPTRYWQDFCRTNPGVIYAAGNPTHVDFRPKGQPVLHLNLWYKKDAFRAVQKLIDNLDREWGVGDVR